MIRTELHSFPFKIRPVNGTDWIDCSRKYTTQNMEPIDHPRGPNHALCSGSGVPTHDNFWGGNGDENNGTVCWVVFLDHRGKLTQLPFWLTLQGAKIFSNVGNGEKYQLQRVRRREGICVGNPKEVILSIGGTWVTTWMVVSLTSPPKKIGSVAPSGWRW